MLGIKGTFLHNIVDVVAKENYSEYPELTQKLDYIKKIIKTEEERFASTIDAGLSILQGLAEKAIQNGKTAIDGSDVFKLYDTFGFPIDLTKEIIAENGLKVDEDGFNLLMKEQKARARAARANISGWSESSKGLISDFPKTEFVGYTQTSSPCRVLGLIADDMELEEINEGDFTLVLDKTPFYAESGGQVGDSGVITSEGLSITVSDVKKQDGVFLHFCTLVSGIIRVGDTVTAEIDVCRRNKIARNHSVCHMLQAALRSVLGVHVEQAGSYVDEYRTRFDFTHYAALSHEEIEKVEQLVNEAIQSGYVVDTQETDIESAKKEGAMALFGEKYGKTVRLVKMGEFSKELCGGTHIDNTAKAGLFKIVSESSVAAGVRRVEAASGSEILSILSEKEKLISDTAKEMKAANPADIAKKAASMQQEIKIAKSEIESLEAKIANSKLEGIKQGARKIGEYTVISARIDGITVDAARGLCDDIKTSDPQSVCALFAVNEGKLNIVVSCGKKAVENGLNAGKIVKTLATICGGGGGGRPDSATAGGRDISKIDEAIRTIDSLLI